MTEIKQCPFCGEKQSLTIYVNHVTKNYIECICGARVQFSNYDGTPGQSLDSLLQMWNRRSNE
ncbi:MAG: Lar family restriction alleviation protein [Candidatus Methanomethylophilaceae archaeon]|nr:Lar family restriction alleviation protein [Candidatus Methanomethylophilaceae archaeon]